jgi:hypothetical protein
MGGYSGLDFLTTALTLWAFHVNMTLIIIQEFYMKRFSRHINCFPGKAKQRQVESRYNR